VSAEAWAEFRKVWSDLAANKIAYFHPESL
jgi:hypothetical protein